MSEKSDDTYSHDLFVTDFPKKGFGIVDYLQGRVHFALLDQMKLMNKSGMSQTQIKETIMASIAEIIDNVEHDTESKNS